MAFIPALISGIGALGGLFGNRSQTQKTSGTQQTNNAFTTMPALSAQGEGVLNPLADKYLSFLGDDPNLKGYQAAVTSDINKMAGSSGRNIAEIYASRGISGPAVGTALASNEMQRGSDITKLQQGIPLLANQLNSQKIGLGTDLFRSIPSGTTGSSFGNTAQQGDVTNPGNMLGGAFGNLGQILAYLFGQGKLGGSSGSNPGNAGTDTGLR